VQGDRPHRIVDFEPFVNEERAFDHQNTGDDSDQDSAL
jgi:hypothetical protein